MNRSAFPLALALLVTALPAVAADQPVSEAEKRVFIDNHLANIAGGGDVSYGFTKRGTLEKGFVDTVKMHVEDAGAARGKTVTAEFLTGERRLSLPEVANAEGNPVIMHFLERDVREMKRLTGGQEGFFRRRIKLALADQADLRPVSFQYAGREIKGRQITITPYVNDPLKERFVKFEKKTYVFTLSDELPGGVYQLKTLVSGAGAEPLVEETLTLEGAVLAGGK